MVATNDITGDRISSKISNDKFRENYDKIFRKNNDDKVVQEVPKQDKVENKK